MQRTGRLCGSGDKAASVCHRGTEGAAGRDGSPGSSPGLRWDRVSQEREGGGVCLRTGRGMAWVAGPMASRHPPSIPLRALSQSPPCAAALQPSGVATGAVPKCRITTGSSGPQEEGGWAPNSSGPGHGRPEARPQLRQALYPVPFPHTVGRGAEKKSSGFSPPWQALEPHLASATGHRAAPSPCSPPLPPQPAF